MGRQLARWRGAWSEYQHEVEEMIDAGDHVVVVARHRGKGRSSGVEVDWQYTTVITLMGKKVVRGRVYDNRQEALEAVGLRE